MLADRLDLARITNMMHSISGKTLFSVLSLAVPFVLLKTGKWHRLLQHRLPATPWRLAFRSFLVGMTLSLFTPARLGELGRAICFPGKQHPVAALVLVDKLIDAIVLANLACMSFVLLLRKWGIPGIPLIVCIDALVWAGGHWLRQRPCRAKWQWLSESAAILLSLSRPVVLTNVGGSIVCFGLMVAQFHLLLSNFAHQPLSWHACTTLPAILLISSLPISLSGLGLREAVAVILLSRYHVSMESAVTVSALLWTVSSVLPALPGLLLLALPDRREVRIAKLDSARSENPRLANCQPDSCPASKQAPGVRTQGSVPVSTGTGSKGTMAQGSAKRS